MVLHRENSSSTLTFLFTDLESSTRLWEQFPQAMKAALERHDAILRDAVEGSNGQVVKSTGDGLLAVFASTPAGVTACLSAQKSLLDEPWGETGPLRVRMGLHVGEAQLRAGDYFGPALNRAARLMSAAHGGQVLLSEVAASLAVDQLPQEAALLDLGLNRLKDLERPEHIFQLLHPDLAADFPPLASLDRRPNNLPAQPTALIGREAELAEITKHLSTEGVRLLTLTGPGGIGKTRTSLQAGAELLEQFDGVYFIDLAQTTDPESVPATIAQTLSVKETSDRPLLDELKAHLQPKKMLLLLDNFEQVTGAAARMAELLRDCPGLKLLVTSREALHIRGEHIFPLSPLGLPEPELKKLSAEQLFHYEAARLFIERAQAVKPDFKLTDENAPLVAEICIRVDGLPLAIELAAARIRLFSPETLLERLGSRLKLLRGGARDLPARQQTLRDAINWSYDLLDGGEKRLFELLSVFQGCTIEAAEAVSGAIEHLENADLDILDGLTSLVDKSLIRQVDQKTGGSRFVMLGTIRDHAAERLEADLTFQADAKQAHAAYYAEFTRLQWERLTGSEREAAIDDLGYDLENVRSAWRYWVVEKDLEQLGKLVDGLWLLFDVRGWYHAMVDLTTDLLDLLASTPSSPERLEQEILLHTSLARALLAVKGYTPQVEEAFNHALELSQAAGEYAHLFPVLRGLYSFYTFRGEFDKGIPIGEQILALAERNDDSNMRVEGHFVLGSSYAFTGNTELGLEHLEQGISLIDPDRQQISRFRLGNYAGVPLYIAYALIVWGLGYPDRALHSANKAVELAKKINHPYSLAYALFHIGFLRFWRREVAFSLECAQAMLDVAELHKFQIWQAVGTCLQGAGLASSGRAEEGLAQIQRGMDIYQELKSPPIFLPLLRGLQAGACGLAGRPEQGIAMLDELLAFQGLASGYGRALLVDIYQLKGNLLLALHPDRPSEAEPWFLQALQYAQDQKALMSELRAAISLTRLWSNTEKAEEGNRLLSEIYARFTEGFNTPDLVEARELLSSY